MIDEKRVLVTGGSGLLGGELRKLLGEAHFPGSAEFNVTDYAQMEAFARRRNLGILVHAAAFTSPPKVDKDPQRAMEVNIVGTVNVVRLCMALGLKLIYISTDYVFHGDRGDYREEDPLYPVNKYAWSKLGGECAARMYDRALIVRTSFGPNQFPYPQAFVDQWTSRESVARFARKLVRLLDQDLAGVIHVGGPRRTVYEYARSLDPSKEIQTLSIRDVNFRVPVDTSLNCDRYLALNRIQES